MTDDDFDFFGDEAQQARVSNVAALDDDPEIASRALELGQSSGVPASAIYGDVEGFERQHKAQLGAGIIGDNYHIAAYLNSHPLAPRLSHDDLGQLDTASQAISRIPAESQMQRAGRAFAEGFGEFSDKAFLSDPFLKRPSDVEWALQNPEVASVLMGIGGLVAAPMTMAGKTFGGVASVVNEFLGREAAGMLEYGLMRGDIRAAGTGAHADIAAIGQSVKAVKPWLDAKRTPPVGIDPLVDKVKIKEAKADSDALSEALTESLKSTTRERNADFYANFARSHVGDREIGISAGAIRDLYGDKVPTPDDNILGWVPGIEAKLAAGEASGGDVRVPLADWLAKVDPEVAKQLEDHIRARPDGITVEEGKNLEPVEKPSEHPLPVEGELPEGVESPKRVEGSIITEPHTLVRGAAGLEPMFSVGDRKVKLERKNFEPEMGPGSRAAGYVGFHDFDLLDEKGKTIGSVNLSEQGGGKKLYIEMIQAGKDAKMYDPNFLGPALIRDLLRQLKAEFPNAETITGHRVSGAREKAGSWEAKSAMPVMKFDEALDAKNYEAFKELLQQKDVGLGVNVTTKPTELYTQHEQELIKATQELIQRVAPGAEFEPVTDISRGNKPGRATGMYMMYKDELPKIFVNMLSNDPLGVGSHEAIHHLRQYGFFTPEEWSILSRTVRDRGWQEQFNIDRRYGSLDQAGKIEEAIADGYRYWEKNRANVPEALHPIFQKLKDFFDALKQRFKEILGKEPDWEDIFGKVDRGEVGRRIDNEPINENAFTGREAVEEQEAPKAANDIDVNDHKHAPTYQAAARAQAVERFVGKDTERGDFEYWKKKATEEEHLGINGKPNAFKAAREASQGGKTSLVIGYNGKRTVFRDGVKVVRESNRDVGDAKYSIEDSIPDIGGKEAEKLRERIQALSGELSVAKSQGFDIKSEEFAERAKDLSESQAKLRSITSGTFGMSVPQYQRYMNLIKKRNTEDLEIASKRALEQQRRTQTKEWKANRTEMRDEVREEIEGRPDIAVDQLFAAEKLKFHPDALSPEQKAMLPKEYLQKKGGVDPNDAAGFFGYHSGDALVERLALITKDRQASGMNAREWMNHLIDTETDRRMEQKYGNLDQRILEEAKDQAISETQLDLLHEEVLHLGLKADSEFPISKTQLRTWNKEIFDKTPIDSISTDEYLRAAGKAGKAAEMSLLKEDFADAFREKQRQNNAMIMASYAKAYEKARKSFDRTAKQFQKREVPSVPAEWTNWIHDLLQRTGNRVNRSVQDLAENIGRQSEYTLADFVEAKEAESFGLRETPVADFLLDPNFRKDMGKLTAEEFGGLKASIDVLVKQGRDEKKIYAAGEAADRDVVLREMRDKLGTFPEKALPDEAPRTTALLKLPRMFMAGMTNIETLLNRWDRADPRGVFNRYLSYPLAKASNTKASLEREYAKAYGDLGPIKDGGKFVEAPFPDPLSRTEANPEGRPWPGFTRKHVLAMLQNAGNKGNWRVLSRGYGVEPEALMEWLHRNTTKEDWDRAQKMGDSVFHSLVGKADVVYENMTGVTIEKIPLEPIETPYGTYKGWYHPLIADPLRKEVWVKGEDGTWQRNATGKRGSVYDDGDYFHASTANGYTKRRTGAVYPLDLNFDVVPSRIKQMIHDIAFRQTIVEAEKVFGNKSFQAEVTKHYGSIYTDLLMPYLKNMAGAESIPSKAGAAASQLSEYLRQNAISTYIGFNPFTALKHGPTAWVMSMREVGGQNFLSAVKSLYAQSADLTLSNSEFAMKHSEELQRRERHWQDTIAGQHSEIEGSSTLREKVIEKGSWLVAQSDMLSAKPTWVAAYNKYVGDGLSHGESIDLADRAVRRAHGSTAQTNQPSMVRGGGPLHGWLTSVYGFFGTAMNRRIEIAHTLNDTYQLGKEGEIKAAAKNIPKLTADFMTYVVWPTMVEEWVTGLNTDDKRGWGAHLISGASMGLASSVLYLRDIVHGLASGHEPGVGLITSVLHDHANLFRDIRRGKEAFNRQHAGKTVGDTLTVFGEWTGTAPKTIANAARFGIDYVNKQQHPKGMAEWLRGPLRGTAKKREEK